MILYLAGPMRGLPAFNFPAFLHAAKRLRTEGHTVWNPAEHDLNEGFDPTTDTAQPLKVYMRHDLPAVLHADAVAVLPGWRQSVGARLEVHVAQTCGIPVLDADTLRPITETILEEAQRLVHGDRGEDYGHPWHDFTRTGIMWGAILDIGEPVPPDEVALCMIALKLSREVHRAKRDNRTDIAGYAETLDMVRQRQAEMAVTA